MSPETKTLLIIYINVALYATCFQLQRPLEPFLVERLLKTADGGGVAANATSTAAASEYARLQSFFSAVQTVGSLASGLAIDRFGVRGGFVMTFAASALSYYLLSISSTIGVLYASKVPTVLQAGFLCAQTAVSQVTADGPERIAALGRLTMAYTIGVVIGPTLGGYLGASGNYVLGAQLAVAGSLVSIVLALLMPAAGSASNKKQDGDSLKSNAADGVVAPVAALSVFGIVRLVWPLLLAKTVTGVANAMRDTAAPLVLKNQFGFDERAMGTLMGATAAVNAVVNGGLLAPLAARFGSNLNALIASALGASALLGLAQAALLSGSFLTAAMAPLQKLGVTLLCAIGMGCSDGPAAVWWSTAVDRGVSALSTHRMPLFIASSFGLSVIQYVLATTLTGESTARVNASSRGTLLGIEHSLCVWCPLWCCFARLPFHLDSPSYCMQASQS